MEYFEFYNIEIQFYPDLKDLSKKFKANTKANHPDLNEGSAEAELLTAKNNKAYRVLKNEKSRVQYILQEGKSFIDNNSLDSMFMMEMMELNESLAEAQMNDDSIEKDLQGVRQRDIDIWNEIAEIGKEHDSKNKSLKEACVAINSLYLKSNYMKRILENFSS